MPRLKESSWIWRSLKSNGFHAFLGDFDNGKPLLKQGEICLKSKTNGHYHVIRENANLEKADYQEEMLKRGCDPMFVVALDLKQSVVLWNHHNSLEAYDLQRYARREYGFD